MSWLKIYSWFIAVFSFIVLMLFTIGAMFEVSNPTYEIITKIIFTFWVGISFVWGVIGIYREYGELEDYEK